MTSSCRTSNLWTVSSRYDRDDLPVLPEEDDWFATPFQEPMETDEVAWQDDEPPRRRRAVRPTGSRSGRS